MDAARAPGLRAWYLEYECHGAPYTWRVNAANEAAADSMARDHLTRLAAVAILVELLPPVDPRERTALQRLQAFDSARAALVICLEIDRG